MYIQLWEPSKQRRLRIKNRMRFVLSLLLLLLTFLMIFIPQKGVGQVEYKPFKVAYGDTYWGIARELQAQGYKPRTDIRAIVHELIQKSGIKAHELREGDIIYLPDFEG